MKTRLNLTIDQSLLESMKTYAANKNTSVSELVETYFKKVSRPARRKNILHLVDQLNTPKINQKVDLKELFYEEQMKKYGF